jgi:hypothetical protein
MTTHSDQRARARLSPQELRDYLTATAIAGRVATPRSDSLAKYRRMASGDPQCMFGLRFSRAWTAEQVLAEMARRCGVSPDPAVQLGPDFIDPELTVTALQAMAARIGEVAAARGTVLMGTGHPAGLLAVHVPVAQHLQAAGCRVLTPATGWSGQLTPGTGPEQGEIRYLQRVAVIASGPGLAHTHGPGAMQAMLAALAQAGEPAPDLVIADHGFAGAAGLAGVRTVGFADCNDPALFIGEAEGLVEVSVPLDDNVQPGLYEPVTAFLLAEADLHRTR